MDREDERDFVEYVRSTGDIRMLPYHSPTLKPQGLEELPAPSSDGFPFHLWFFNRDISSRLVLEYIPEQECYMVEEFASSVVEFRRTVCKKGTMHPGRLWAEFKFTDKQGNWVLKEPEFKKWYESMAKWIRKNFSREIDPDFYFGPGALRKLKGGQVEVRYF